MNLEFLNMFTMTGISMMINIAGGILIAAAVLFVIYSVYKIITGVIVLWWNWIESD